MSNEIITTVSGVLRDPVSAKDYDVDRLLAEFSVNKKNMVGEKYEDVEEHYIPEYTPISNQGSAGTCVANSICDMFEILVGIEKGGKWVQQYSRRFLYFISRAAHDATDRDTGTYPRLAFSQLTKAGIVLEKYFPYSDRLKDLTTSPPVDMFTMASNNRINSFWRLKKTGSALVDQIVGCIVNNHPVEFCTPVNREFQLYRGGEKVFGSFPNPVGNHSMLLTGFKRRGSRVEFVGRNSWGSGWGINGHFWMAESALNKCFDLWTATKMDLI